MVDLGPVALCGVTAKGVTDGLPPQQRPVPQTIKKLSRGCPIWVVGQIAICEPNWSRLPPAGFFESIPAGRLGCQPSYGALEVQLCRTSCDLGAAFKLVHISFKARRAFRPARDTPVAAHHQNSERRSLESQKWP